MKLRKSYQDYLEHMRLMGLSKKTIAEHTRFLYGALSNSIQDKNIKKIKISDIGQIIEAGRIHGITGPQRAVCVFRRLLKYLKDSGHKLPVDFRDFELPKLPQKPVEYLTMEELELVRSSLDVNSLSGLRTRALIEVLLDSGMRISEACSLDIQDINWDKKEARVVNAKNKNTETVYFSARSLYWLKRYIESRRDGLPCLFVSGRGRLLSVSARNYLRTHTIQLGIKKHIKHHIFRKTFATWLIQGGVNIKEVQTLCRHRSEQTTLKAYVGVNKEEAKVSHAQIFENVR